MGKMTILLTQDVDNLGDAGEIHTVASGYARNFLMPRGMAILATKGALKQAEEIRQAALRRRAQERANAQAQAEVLGGQRLLFEARAGENDRLYGSVTSNDIADRLEELAGFEVDRRRIQLDQPIRELGLYPLSIRLMAEVNAEFTVAVVREEETWADAERREAERQARLEAEAAAAAAEAEEAESTEMDEEAEPAEA